MKNILIFMAFCLAVLGVSCGGSSETSTSESKSYAEIREEEPNYMGDSTIYDGIVLSHENNVVDWDKVAQDSLVQFVYLKATDGASVQDSKYKKSLKAARKANSIAVYEDAMARLFGDYTLSANPRFSERS